MGLFNSLKAQKVNSKAYDLLLSGLLSHSVNELSVEEVENLNDPLFVDAREQKEYDISHIKNSVWIGYENPKLDKLKEVDKSKPIVVYCSVGYRSEKIAEQLKQQGFNNVYNLYGGIFEWKNQGKAVYDHEEKQTEKVHAYNKAWGIWLSEGIKIYE